MSWELQAVAALGGEDAEELFPIDVTDVLERCPTVGEHLFSTLVVAVLKEPCSTRIFVDNVSDHRDAAAVRAALVKVAREHTAAPMYDKESEQMIIGGSARWLGTATALRALGIIGDEATLAESQSNPGSADVKCGRMRATYALVNDVEPFMNVWNSTAKLEGEWASARQRTTLVELMRCAVDVCTKGEYGKRFQNNAARGYCHKFICRKLYLALWQYRVATAGPVTMTGVPAASFDALWGVPAASFDAMCPDQHTLYLPRDLDGAGVSRFFFGREDRGMHHLFVLSMSACLWTSVRKDRGKAALAKVMNWIRDGSFMTRARALKKEWGVTPHPLKVVEDLEAR